MRNYSNFLLFEDLLDSLPSGSAFLLNSANVIINPVVSITSMDCNTLLGTYINLNYEQEGKVELATGLPLTRDRISDLLAEGKYTISIRETNSCKEINGICQACYQASFRADTPPEVGSLVQVISKFNYQSDLIIANGVNSEYILTQSDEDYYSVEVIHDGSVIDSSEYVLESNKIIFNNPPSRLSVYVIHFFKESSDPLLGYISKTFTGGLLGLKPLPTHSLPIRRSIYDLLLTDSYLNSMVQELRLFPEIPATYKEYIDSIHDRLEKALYILYLYALFGNIET